MRADATSSGKFWLSTIPSVTASKIEVARDPNDDGGTSFSAAVPNFAVRIVASSGLVAPPVTPAANTEAMVCSSKTSAAIVVTACMAIDPVRTKACMLSSTCVVGFSSVLSSFPEVDPRFFVTWGVGLIPWDATCSMRSETECSPVGFKEARESPSQSLARLLTTPVAAVSLIA